MTLCCWYVFVREWPSVHDGFWTAARIDAAFALDDWLESNP